ncbi:hypothetical protein BGX31_003393 [Mortierella sp. GBA43]|nr:hypothetical protein BGX31_003393 [Mortierella sp. GBA43]
MDDTQSFRQAGSTEIVKISCYQDNGQNVVYWDDVLQVYPAAQYVKHGDVAVTRLRDSGPDRNKPHRIRHYPGAVLDVVLFKPAGEALKCSTSHSGLSTNSGQNSGSHETITDSSTDDNVVENLEISAQIEVPEISDVDVSHASIPSFGATKDSKAIVSFKQVIKLAQERVLDPLPEQRLVSSLTPDVQTQVLGCVSSDEHGWIVRAIQDGLLDQPNEQLIICLRDLKNEMARNNEMVSRNTELASTNNELALKNNELATKSNELASTNNELAIKTNELASKNMELMEKMLRLQEAFDTQQKTLETQQKTLATQQKELDAKQDEMIQLQNQALKQLALLQNRVQALMIQTYELHEYPIPRLFVILPQDSSSWNPKNLLSNKFRLYFLCECGEHTQPPNTKDPHHIHLAKHEGYEINRPKEFFRQYGSYALTILRMLKFGVSVAGVAIPAVSLLVRTDALDKATTSLKMLSGNLQTGLDRAIGCLENFTADNDGSSSGVSKQLRNNEALEGADLRKLKTFLKNKDGNKVLGNMFRIVTPEGHVKWVCIDHYRETYHGKAVNDFRDTVETLRGSFDENIGLVNVHLKSRVEADQFYRSLERAKSVNELDIVLDWDTTQSDFKKLRDTILKSNVRALKVDLKHQDSPTSDLLNRNRRHDPILDIMRHPSTCCFSIMGAPEDFIQRSSLLSRNDEFSHLRHLGIDISAMWQDIPGVKNLLSRTMNLTMLDLIDFEDGSNKNYDTIDTSDGLERFFDVDGGCATIRLQSTIQAELVSHVLDNNKVIHGLNVNLRVNVKGISVGSISNQIRQHDSILDIMGHPLIYSVTVIRTPEGFIQHSHLLSRDDDLSNLRRLDLDMSALIQDIQGIKDLVSRAPNLISLRMDTFKEWNTQVDSDYSAVRSSGGSFEVDEDRVNINIRSGIQAELVYQVLKNNNAIHGLDIDLHVNLDDDSTGDAADSIRQCEPIFNIMRHPSTHFVAIKRAPKAFILGSSLQFQHNDLAHLRRLNLDLSAFRNDILSIKSLLSLMPNLDSLTVDIPRERGSFEEQIKVNSEHAIVHLWSRRLMDLAYKALETIKSINELDLGIYWNTTKGDFEKLLGCLKRTNVGVLHLRANMKAEWTGDISDQVPRHDSFFDVMRHPSTQFVAITGAPSNFIQRSNLPSQEGNFLHLKHLDLDLSELKRDIPGIKELLSRMPNLVTLVMDDSEDRNAHIHHGRHPTESLKGSSDMEMDRMVIRTKSRELMKLAYGMLEKIKSINELAIDLNWETTESDLRRLQDILAGIRVGALKFRATMKSAGSTSGRIQLHDSFFDIMRHPSTNSVLIVRAPGDLIQQSSLLSQDNSFPHLKHLDLDLSKLKRDIPGIKELLSRMPNLATLVMDDSEDRNAHIHHGCHPTESLKGSSDMEMDRMAIRVKSRELVELAYDVLEKIKSINELAIDLNWETTESDIERFREILTGTSVGALKFRANMKDESAYDDSDRIRRHDSYFDIMRHPSTESVVIVGAPGDFIQRSSLLSRDDGFPNLKHLCIDLSALRQDIPGIKALLSKSPNISCLALNGSRDVTSQVYSAIAEQQTYPIVFDHILRIDAPASGDSHPPMTPLENVMSMVRVHDEILPALRSPDAILDMSKVDVFSGNGSSLKELDVSDYNNLGEAHIKYLSTVVSWSELRSLAINMRGEEREELAQILESIQWKHIRILSIWMDKESVGTRAMKALVEGRNKEKGQVELDDFMFLSYSDETVSTEQTLLLRSFMASTPIKRLVLDVRMTPSDMESMFSSMDMSLLRMIHLNAKGYSTSEVDDVLDCLVNAHNLQEVAFYSYTPTPEQTLRMQEKGVEF